MFHLPDFKWLSQMFIFVVFCNFKRSLSGAVTKQFHIAQYKPITLTESISVQLDISTYVHQTDDGDTQFHCY